MKVCLCIPNGGTVKARTMTSVFSALPGLLSQGVEVLLADTESSYSYNNRWLAGKLAVERECDYLWMVDADNTFPSDAFFRLQAHGKDLIGAPYNYRRLPLMTTVKMLKDGEIVIPSEIPKELFSCYAIGFGCVLISVAALKKVPQPWFASAWHPVTGEAIRTDDVWFCEQARKVGIETWCDPTIEMKHVGDFLY
jgi:hypothetical protein